MTDPDETETTRLICALRGNDAAYFPDDKFTPCIVCGREVRYRPHAPEPSEKICSGCFVKEAQRGMAIMVTGETIADVIKVLRRKP